MVDPLVRDLASLTHGDHVCLPYEHSDQCTDVVAPFIADGLSRGERCIYVIEDDRREDLLRQFSDAGINASRALDRGALYLLSPDELYFRAGRGQFDPEETLAMVDALLASALADGFTGVRGSGEVRAADRHSIAWSTMVTYEARFNERFSRRPVVALCRYRRDEWPAAMVADALRTHPTAIVSGRVCRNPYYEQPDVALAGDGDEARVDWMLRQLRRSAAAELRREQMTCSLAGETARLSAEIQARAASEEELARAVRLRDQFLDDLAKELAGPIGGLAAELEDPARAGSFSKLRAHLKRLGGVIEELKDVCRITNRRQSACVDDVDLADVARQVALRHRDRLAASGSVVSLRAADARVDSCVKGRWERRRLEQLIANLISNAAKRGGGHPIEIGVASEDGIALVSVRYRGRPLPSDGKGADDEIAVFEHGGRTSADDPHSHLASAGLWVAREIAGAFGGTLAVASDGAGPETSTTITVELPRARPLRRKTPLA